MNIYRRLNKQTIFLVKYIGRIRVKAPVTTPTGGKLFDLLYTFLSEVRLNFSCELSASREDEYDVPSTFIYPSLCVRAVKAPEMNS